MNLKQKKIGRVILVGAGPGDPGLITVRGRDAIKRADVVVFDHLVCKELVDIAPAHAKHIYVGKKVGKHTLKQEEINELLVREARLGHDVVRLKGGDPFIFGRGAEECQLLRANGIQFEIVPGVSAVAAVPAYAGIPITCRDYSTSFIAVTGHEHACKEESDVDWASIARVNSTLVIFMGVLNIGCITNKLIENGKSPETPTAVIRWGTYSHQKTIIGSLSTIADQVQRANLRPPGLIVIGEVVRFRESLNWFETRPLFGKTIAVPRARSQASRLSQSLIGMGANVIEIPAARHEPIQAANPLGEILHEIRDYDWIVFTDDQSVHSFFDSMNQKGYDTRSLANCRIGAIGDETISALSEHGVKPDFIPTRFCSAHVVEELSSQFPLDKVRILIPCQDEIHEGLSQSLQNAGAIVKNAVIFSDYDNATEEFLLNGQRLDLVAFTCSTTVHNFINRIGINEAKRIAGNTVFASIGPLTSSALHEYGFEVKVQPQQSDIQSLTNAIAVHCQDDSEKD